MEQIRYDDIEAWKRRVGEPWSPFGPQVTITQEMVNRFADVTGDNQWIHVDVERARRESPLGTTIVHGFFLVSLIPRLRLRQDLEVTGYGSILNYGADKLRFISPVPAGSTIHCRNRIYQADKKPKGVLVGEELEVSIVGQSERPALTYSMLYLYLPPAPSAS